jgi:hypothetical protein
MITRKTSKVRILSSINVGGSHAAPGQIWEVSRCDAFHLVAARSAELLEGEEPLEASSPGSPRIYIPHPEDPSPQQVL